MVKSLNLIALFILVFVRHMNSDLTRSNGAALRAVRQQIVLIYQQGGVGCEQSGCLCLVFNVVRIDLIHSFYWTTDLQQF